MKCLILMLAIFASVVTALQPKVNATTLGAYAQWYYDTTTAINVPNGYPISFPYDGQVKGSYMSRVNDNTFRILFPGTYLVQFDVVSSGTAQLGVKVGGVPQPQCVVGISGSKGDQLNGVCIITTTSISVGVQIYNPSGSTIQIPGEAPDGTGNQGRISILALSGITSENDIKLSLPKNNITSPVFGYAHFYNTNAYSVNFGQPLIFPTTGAISGGIQKASDSQFRLVNKGRYLVMYRLTGDNNIFKPLQVCLFDSSNIIPGSCAGKISVSGQLTNAIIYHSTTNNALISLKYTGDTNIMNVQSNSGGSSNIANSLVIIQLSNPFDYPTVNDFDVGFFYTLVQPDDPLEVNGIANIPLTSGTGLSMSLTNQSSVKLNNAGYYMIIMQTYNDQYTTFGGYMSSNFIAGGKVTHYLNTNIAITSFMPIIIRTTSANTIISMNFVYNIIPNTIYQTIGGQNLTGPSMVVLRIG